ncbi:Panacea domain-containing protein [Sphingobium sp. AntQ-1]|uniref:Panacea domain-containing protein n=1 Tax=Sphingobium sp. AntQ-1 TaxID=2930091 RepID=UPI00234E70FD|nr:type II toxin-antitoxin system antitoxin SocA domain-containing protein [Sphingobium sp. AntQ-1]
MVDKAMNPELLAELQQLALLSEADIDTSDSPEVLDWSGASRGLFAEQPTVQRGYDVRAIANWFLARGQAIGKTYSNLALNKLVYFAVERSLVDRNILLTPARIEAWSHGPVFREIYQSFQSFGDKVITDRAKKFSVKDRAMILAYEQLEPEDENFLEDIVNSFGKLSASVLREVSHATGGPWYVVWHYHGQSNPGMEITPAIIFEHAPERRGSDEK